MRSLAELDDDELELVAEAWRRRARDAPAGYLHALVNEGREAGASLPALALAARLAPGRAARAQLAVERERWQRRRSSATASSLACPWARRLPYES